MANHKNECNYLKERDRIIQGKEELESSISTLIALLQEQNAKLIEVEKDSKTKDNTQDNELKLIWQSLTETRGEIKNIKDSLKDFREHMDNGWRNEFIQNTTEKMMYSFLEMQSKQAELYAETHKEKEIIKQNTKSEIIKAIVNKIIWILGIILTSLLGAGGIISFLEGGGK